jgi:hypothetical protein
MRFNPEEYETVDERLHKFWADHPQGRIETGLLSDPKAIDEVVFWAAVWFDLGESHARGTGHASEIRGGAGANQNCHLENAETSAIGRALANAGYTTKKRPSREEMRKAQPESRGDQRARQAVEAQERPLPVTRPAVQPPLTDVAPVVSETLREELEALYRECGGDPTDADKFRQDLARLLKREVPDMETLLPEDLEDGVKGLRWLKEQQGKRKGEQPANTAYAQGA